MVDLKVVQSQLVWSQLAGSLFDESVSNTKDSAQRGKTDGIITVLFK